MVTGVARRNLARKFIRWLSSSVHSHIHGAYQSLLEHNKKLS